MKKKVYTIVMLLCVFVVKAQDSTDISGYLQDKYGGLAGATIKEVGTTRGTQSDFDGYYKFRVPVGSTVEISFIGFETKRFVVQAGGKLSAIGRGERREVDERKQERPAQKKHVTDDNTSKKSITMHTAEQDAIPIAPQDFLSFYDDLRFQSPNSEGIAALDTVLPLENKVIYVADFPMMSKVKHRVVRDSLGRNKLYYTIIKRSPSDVFYLQRPQITYSLTSAVNMPNRLPRVQETWAQGRPVNGVLQWQGADAGESFSWGPRVSDLSSMGNAVPTFNRFSSFGRGLVFSHNVSINWGVKERKVIVSGYRKSTGGYFSSSNETEYSGQAKVIVFSKPTIKLELQGRAATADGRFVLQGANYAQIMESSVLTPATFDNLNGLLPSAADKTAAWKTSNGNIRSFSGAQPLNPYYLMAINGDTKKTNTALAGLTFMKRLLYDSVFEPASYRTFPSLCELRVNSSIQGNDNFVQYGNERKQFYTQYDTKQQQAIADVGLWASKETKNMVADILLGVRYDNEQAQIRRLFTNQIVTDTSFKITRQTNTGYVASNFEFWKMIKLSARNTFTQSSQLARPALLNPSLGVSHKLSSMRWFMNNESLRHIYDLRIYVNYSNLAYLPSLLPEYGALNALQYSYQPGLSYYESHDYYYPATSNERVKQYAGGIGLSLFRNKVVCDFSVFNTNTSNHLSPVVEKGTISYQNAVNYTNRGVEFSVSYRFNHLFGYSTRGDYEIYANFQKNNPLVTAILNNQNELAIAGTADVYKAAIVGQPYGVLVGSAYMRNAEGKMIIGDDGFPLVNPQKQIIGNPNPDFIIDFGGNAYLSRLTVSFVFAFQKGGQIWNGTRGVMNYYGVSQETAEQRNSTGYVFAGLTADAAQNTKAVDFAPLSDVAKNRWQRYGVLGVAEDLVEDATCLRLQNIEVMYRLPIYRYGRRLFFIDEISVGAFVRNIILVSAYKGVDPQSSLFGYATGGGLDLFNAPAMSQIGAKCSIIFNKQ